MIYLDSAATSFRKPESVRRAMDGALARLSSPGRGGYPAAMRAADMCWLCRESAGGMFGCEPMSVVFTSNATHGLNIAINSVVPRGGRVVVSGYEHNAVTRPLAARSAIISVASAPLFDNAAILERFRRLLPGADACVCTHVSNVFGWILPIYEIAGMCADYGVPLVVDASQSAGTLPVDMRSLGARFAAMPGHKGLHGPQGTGLLLCSGEAEPLICGGTGSMSASPNMPDFLPDRLEAGTHNMPGIAGLKAGLDFVKRLTPERILRHEQRLRARLERELSAMPGLEVFGGGGAAQAGVLSVRSSALDSEVIAERLGRRGVAVRAGLHCAPLAHESEGTLRSGTVRFSFSPFNSEAEIMRTSQIMRDILIKS